MNMCAGDLCMSPVYVPVKLVGTYAMLPYYTIPSAGCHAQVLACEWDDLTSVCGGREAAPGGAGHVRCAGSTLCRRALPDCQSAVP